LIWPADSVAVPERHLAGLTERRDHIHPVVRDLGDPPARRSEREDIADARFVDHLLVKLSYPSPGTLSRDEHSEQPAIGDRAAAGDGDALRSGAAGEGSGVPVPDQSRT